MIAARHPWIARLRRLLVALLILAALPQVLAPHAALSRANALPIVDAVLGPIALCLADRAEHDETAATADHCPLCRLSETLGGALPIAGISRALVWIALDPMVIADTPPPRTLATPHQPRGPPVAI